MRDRERKSAGRAPSTAAAHRTVILRSAPLFHRVLQLAEAAWRRFETHRRAASSSTCFKRSDSLDARPAEVRIMMEYWRQCALWLINCKVLPANHRVTWESAQVFDLAQTLRDGVLLCHLLNNLRPQSINLKEINLRPQMSQVKERKAKETSDPKERNQTSATTALV